MKVPESPVCLERRTGPEACPSAAQDPGQSWLLDAGVTELSAEGGAAVLEGSPARMGKSGGVGLAWKQGKGAEWMSQGWFKGMVKSRRKKNKNRKKNQ